MCACDKVLVVDDPVAARAHLCRRLENLDYRVCAVGTVERALAALRGRPDLVVLDRSRPDGDGLDVMREAERRAARAAFLLLSGVPAERDVDVLVTRVREALAAHGGTVTALAGARLPFGPFELDVARRVLHRTDGGSGPVDMGLTGLEFDLLFYLLRNAGHAATREELLDRVWGYDRYPKTRTVDYHVAALRKKIEPQGGKPRYIVTVQRVGYRFAP